MLTTARTPTVERMFTAIYPALIAIIGLLVYALTPSTNVKVSQIGFASFCCGLLVCCFILGGKGVHLP